MTLRNLLLAPFLASALGRGAIAQPFAQIAAYDFGADRAALNAVDRQILDAGTTTETLLSIEEKLLPVLATPGLKPAPLTFVCEALGRIGSARCVPALVPLLSTADGADDARMALERLPIPEAGEEPCAPRSATAPDAAKSGIANSLGARRDPAAVPLLAPLLAHADGKLSAAAALALGRIGTPAALAALTAARTSGATRAGRRHPALRRVARKPRHPRRR
ncbi:MAG: HEAT repeat domain-containing protein [Kiritimatiellia bacterium]